MNSLNTLPIESSSVHLRANILADKNTASKLLEVYKNNYGHNHASKITFAVLAIFKNHLENHMHKVREYNAAFQEISEQNTNIANDIAKVLIEYKKIIANLITKKVEFESTLKKTNSFRSHIGNSIPRVPKQEYSFSLGIQMQKILLMKGFYLY
ncbi:MAG: hypothetical protein H0X29_09105 [Parachlamydiaceae bacterium]|nr:hypothetical protein [Parachlamydiaceae bacterium]